MSYAGHTDVVGSLLRPPELQDARQRLARREIEAPEFKAVEDRAVADAVALQEEAGLEVVTDGEMRRLSFQSQLAEAVEGFVGVDLDAYLWGGWKGDERSGDLQLDRPAYLGVVGKLRQRRHLSAEEFVYLRACTTRTPKITIPSPGLFANLWSPELSRGAYPTLSDFMGDVADILREEVEELVRLGAEYIQLDAPHYPLLLDSAARQFYESRGWSLEQWLQQGIQLDNAVMGDLPGVTFGLHL